MSSKTNLAPLFIVVGIAALLQLVLIGLDCRQTPIGVAKDFAHAYYYLDSEMQDYLCATLAKEGETVTNYLIQKDTEAYRRGLSTNYLRHKFLKLHVDIVESGQDSIKVHLSGSTRVCINPAFMLVGKLFGIGQDYPVDETLELVKENDSWRVCGNPFGLNPQV
ncbi:MAG: hypothetical protein PVI54_03540 [Desulfobacteraceae bacterium]|jgi:hypothetical protein